MKIYHGALRAYLIGFVLSILLTLGAYFCVTEHLFSGAILLFAIGVLAVVQAAVQLHYFLYLGQELKPYWKLHLFIGMVILGTILVGGSLWIMYSLNYRMT